VTHFAYTVIKEDYFGLFNVARTRATRSFSSNISSHNSRSQTSLNGYESRSEAPDGSFSSGCCASH